jgi:hypothetical protein
MARVVNAALALALITLFAPLATAYARPVATAADLGSVRVHLSRPSRPGETRGFKCDRRLLRLTRSTSTTS